MYRGWCACSTAVGTVSPGPGRLHCDAEDGGENPRNSGGLVDMDEAINLLHYPFICELHQGGLRASRLP